MARKKKASRGGDGRSGDGVEFVGDANASGLENDEDLVEIPGWASKKKGSRKGGRRGGSHASAMEGQGSQRSSEGAAADMEEHRSASPPPPPPPQAVPGKKRRASERPPLEADDDSSGAVAKRIRDRRDTAGDDPRLADALVHESSGGAVRGSRNSLFFHAGECPAIVSDGEPSVSDGKGGRNRWKDSGDRLAIALGAASLSPKRGNPLPSDRSLPERKPFPSLPQEPDPDADDICRICVRFPDGKRVQRRFVLSDPIQYIWSLCASESDEVAEGKPFRLMHAIPGCYCALRFDMESTISEAGVAGSLLSLTWD